MDYFEIEGPTRISGEVSISGSKNASLPILAATLLTEEEVILENVPNLKDIRSMLELLAHLGKKFTVNGNVVTFATGKLTSHVAPYEIVSKMRASISVLGPLVAKEGRADVSFPGGCAIGPRPIDLHIKGIEALGAVVEIHHGSLTAEGKLTGTKIHLAGSSGSSVLATDNVMMAAVFAEGETIIEAAALEPEVVDAANFLIAMGADISGVGTSVLKIKGVKKLGGCRYRIIADRIETGTFLAAAMATGGELFAKDGIPEHLEAVLKVFEKMGAKIECRNDGIKLTAPSEIKPIEIETLPYPDFPTDMQSQLMAVALVSKGISVIIEKIFPERFIHVDEFNRLGAEVKVEDASAVISGVDRLEGAEVMASDLRAGAALVIAALASEGTTKLHRVYHIDRGYEKIEEKFNSIGAKITRRSE